MSKPRAPKKREKRFQGVDPLALAELQAASVDARAQRERPLTKEQESSWTADVASALDRRHAMHFYALRGKLLRQALTDSRLSIKALALKTGEVLDDRLRGRPQTTEPTHGNLIVHFGGLDPSRLPDGPPKPALPKEANATIVPPKPTLGSQSPPTFPRNAVDGPRTVPEVPDD
jgi:hypothetical protein